MDGVIQKRPMSRGFVVYASNGQPTYMSRKGIYDSWRLGRCYYVEHKTGKVYTNVPDRWIFGHDFREVVNARELLELSRRKDLPARTRTKAAEG